MGIEPEAGKNKGESILLIGAAGGVGSIACQLAKWAGLTVIGTASRPESAAWAKERGADHIINHHKPFAPQLQKIGFEQVPYIFCLNDTQKHWSNMTEVIAPQGKICSIVGTDQPVDLMPLFNKSVTFVWELMFTRPMFQTEDMEVQHQILDRLSKLVDDGVISTTLRETLEPINAENLRKAHRRIESGRMIGKLVLENF